jgi:thiol-disulfide isomerase/thioredoxin
MNADQSTSKKRFSPAFIWAHLWLLLMAPAFAQGELSAGEQEDLRRVLSEGSGSASDLIRSLESHLAKYPDSPKKEDIERALTKAAIQANDARRILLYGERVLERQPGDLSILEPVCRTLASDRNPESAKKGLEWSRRYEDLVRGLMNQEFPAGPGRAKRKEELDQMLGRALLYEAIAAGTLGDWKASAELARKSFEAYPSSEPAAQLGKSLSQAGKLDEAIRAYADAFTIADSRATDAVRAAIRLRMGELYQRAKGTEKGLGDIILEAYDRNAALVAQRRLALKQLDPNLDIANPMQFTLSGLNGDKLKLASLAGKVIVMDFWATWCAPCRAQHPLYDELRRKFAARPDVVFLSINTDEDRAAVKSFVDEQNWSEQVYFEDGLSANLRVSAIPTTIIFGKNGEIVTRMNGFDPSTFVDVVSGRINDALKQGG